MSCACGWKFDGHQFARLHVGEQHTVRVKGMRVLEELSACGAGFWIGCDFTCFDLDDVDAASAFREHVSTKDPLVSNMLLRKDEEVSILLKDRVLSFD